LLYGSKIGDDIAFADDKVIGARNFVNKVWNASKFVIMNLEGFDGTEIKLDAKYLKLIEENNGVIKQYKKYFDKLDITGSATLIYKYF
jgi:valyl-tRNA synthetase